MFRKAFSATFGVLLAVGVAWLLAVLLLVAVLVLASAKASADYFPVRYECRHHWNLGVIPFWVARHEAPTTGGWLRGEMVAGDRVFPAKVEFRGLTQIWWLDPDYRRGVVIESTLNGRYFDLDEEGEEIFCKFRMVR